MPIVAEPAVQEVNFAQRELISYALRRLRDDSHALLQAINDKPAPQDPPADSPPAAPEPPTE